MDLHEMLMTRKLVGGGSGGGGGGGSSSGEMTDIGADIYLVMEGQCMNFLEFMLAMGGLEVSPDMMARARAEVSIFVRDEIPLINLHGVDADDLPVMFCVAGDGAVYQWNRGWIKLSEDSGLPDHGWIDKSALDALDYTDPSNVGLYAVRTVRYPMLDGTLTDLTSDLDIVPRFSGSNFLNTVNLPNATTIAVRAFYRCPSITSVNIPSVIAIGEYAFQDCTALGSIALPDSTFSIGKSAFQGCTALTNIAFAGTVEQWNAIILDRWWNHEVPATEVVCSDGVVQLV
jgi:hypothetical protein